MNSAHPRRVTVLDAAYISFIVIRLQFTILKSVDSRI
jgi:hypothetical protein